MKINHNQIRNLTSIELYKKRFVLIILWIIFIFSGVFLYYLSSAMENKQKDELKKQTEQFHSLEKEIKNKLLIVEDIDNIKKDLINIKNRSKIITGMDYTIYKNKLINFFETKTHVKIDNEIIDGNCIDFENVNVVTDGMHCLILTLKIPQNIDEKIFFQLHAFIENSMFNYVLPMSFTIKKNISSNGVFFSSEMIYYWVYFSDK